MPLNCFCARAGGGAGPPFPPPATITGSSRMAALPWVSTSLCRGLVPTSFFWLCLFWPCSRQIAGRFLCRLRWRDLDRAALDFLLQAIEVGVELNPLRLEPRGFFRR